MHKNTSYWLTSTNLPAFDQLTEDTETEITIIGAGITGITLAYLLSKQGKKVVLIERSKILHGTTGYTTAKITAQHGLIYRQLINNFGEETAAKYYKANSASKDFIRQIIQEENIECLYNEQDSYVYTTNGKNIEYIQKEKEAYDLLGISGELVNEVPIDIPIEIAIKMKNQAQFHPLKYLETLIKKCLDQGVKIYEHTIADDLEDNKNPTVILKDGKRIRSNFIAITSHFPFTNMRNLYFAKMAAERSYVVGVEIDENYAGGMYINIDEPSRSIRCIDIDGTRMLLLGGENHKTGDMKDEPYHYRALEEFGKNAFNTGSAVYKWSTQDLMTADKIPYIGRITKNQNRILVATGYNKWGMTQGTIAAKELSQLITEGKSDFEDLYDPSRKVTKGLVKGIAVNSKNAAKYMIQGKFDMETVPLERVHELSKDEAMITRIGGQRAGIYKDLNDELHAVDTTCTHMGCETNWNKVERTWDCPCHGSRFNYCSKVLEGPAIKPLNKLQIDES